MTLYFILSINLLICTLLIFKFYRVYKRQSKCINLLTDTTIAQIHMLKFIVESNVCNLWKIRQEIYNWSRRWETDEEYEAAQQAQIMMQNIEKLIDIHLQTINNNENTEGTNGQGV